MTVKQMRVAKQQLKVIQLKGELASGLQGIEYKKKIREYLNEKEKLRQTKAGD